MISTLVFCSYSWSVYLIARNLTNTIIASISHLTLRYWTSKTARTQLRCDSAAMPGAVNRRPNLLQGHAENSYLRTRPSNHHALVSRPRDLTSDAIPADNGSNPVRETRGSARLLALTRKTRSRSGENLVGISLMTVTGRRRSGRWSARTFNGGHAV